MASVRKLITISALIYVGASGASLAADCRASTKAKLAAVEASQSDRNLICAGMAMVGAAGQDSFTVRDYANLVTSGQRLRREGYSSPTMYLELIWIAGLRSSSEVELVANAHSVSKGCLTPGLVAQDMMNAVKNSPNEALQMYRGWNRDFFNTYIVMIGHSNSCSFR